MHGHLDPSEGTILFLPAWQLWSSALKVENSEGEHLGKLQGRLDLGCETAMKVTTSAGIGCGYPEKQQPHEQKSTPSAWCVPSTGLSLVCSQHWATELSANDTRTEVHSMHQGGLSAIFRGFHSS